MREREAETETQIERCLWLAHLISKMSITTLEISGKDADGSPLSISEKRSTKYLCLFEHDHVP